jgi:hypothetical protein
VLHQLNNADRIHAVICVVGGAAGTQAQQHQSGHDHSKYAFHSSYLLFCFEYKKGGSVLKQSRLQKRRKGFGYDPDRTGIMARRNRPAKKQALK